jgi:hypothetical protein
MLDAKTKRYMKKRLLLQVNDPVMWILDACEWRGGYDVGGGYWNHQCLFCKGNRPDGKKGPIPTGHKRGCIMSRALRVYRAMRRKP